jgi:hypothetical protein
MKGYQRLQRALELVRATDRRTVGREVARRAWGEKTYLGLRCDLSELPDRRAAKIPLTMIARDCADFTGFEIERQHATGADQFQVLIRERLCALGVKSLYVATSHDEMPMYCQWLIHADDQDLLDASGAGEYAKLAGDEVLLEGAYTFTPFRGVGAMADGMWQLLSIARGDGARCAFTYVADDNIPSLRGCANVGFVADHVHLSVRRFGRRRTEIRGLDDEAREAWARATAPRSHKPTVSG